MQSDRITYDLNIVADLESTMTQSMPKSWIESLMFLKENNVCAPTGLAPKRKTKEIQLHYGNTNKDEWRISQTKMKESIGGLLRKMGDANFDAVKKKIIDICSDNTAENLKTLVDNLQDIVSKNEISHDVMIRFIEYLKNNFSSQNLQICPTISREKFTPLYGIWSHKCFQNSIIEQSLYIENCKEMMKIYHSLEKEKKNIWAPTFEYALKHSVLDSWWKPRLKSIIDDPDTPLPLCFKIEDYFEN